MRDTLETARAVLSNRARVRVAAATTCAAAGLAVVPLAAAAEGGHRAEGAAGAAAAEQAAPVQQAAARQAAGQAGARTAAAVRRLDQGWVGDRPALPVTEEQARQAAAHRKAEEARRAEDARRANEARRAEQARERERQAHEAEARRKAADAGAKQRASRSAPRGQAPSAVSASGWARPVNAYRLSSGFAQAGSHWAHTHSGQDFAVPTGTPVQAVHGGVVVAAGWGGAYGNNVVVRHAPGVYSQYGHLSRIQVGVGQWVGASQRIGLSGNTGNSTGPHLHFEIRTSPYYGSAVEPMSFLRGHGVRL